MNKENKLLTDSQAEVLLLVNEAKKDLLTFSQLVDPTYIANWHHEVIAKRLERAVEQVKNNEKVRIMITVPPRHGKQMSHDTPVLTPNGWTSHGLLKPGDKVFNREGKAVEVQWESGETASDIVVEFSDGSKFYTHRNHEWVVYDRHQHKERVVETSELLNTNLTLEGARGKRGHRYRFSVDANKEIEFSNKNLLINPYALGVWLGDGKSTGVAYYHFKGLVSQLRKLNLYDNKHIPEEYLCSSKEQRLELLAGLIDTDGSIDKRSCYRFSTCNKALAEGVRDLVVSLGSRAYIMEYQPRLSTSGVQGRKVVYQVRFNTHHDIPVALNRKLNRNKRYVMRRRSIISVGVAANPKKGKCIQVEGGVYLVGKNLIPTHNSRQATQLFPAWLLGIDPQIPIITTSYSADLAEKFGQLTKDIVISEPYKMIFPNSRLRKDSKSKGDWKLTKGGSYTAVGVGGPITGKGAKIAIIDDVLKNREEAESQQHRKKIKEWYTSTLYTRLEGYGAVIVIMTRWHDDDLAGWLLEEDRLKKEKGETGENWEVFNFPAIALEDEYFNEELKRKEGEALWEDKYSLDNLKNIQANIGVYDWNSLYQQTPILAETQEFKESMFRYFTDDDIKDKNLKYFTIVDPAISQKKSADNTVVLTVGKDMNGPNWYRIREDAGKYTPSQTIDLIFKHYEEYKSTVALEVVAYQRALKYSIEEKQRERQVYFSVTEIKSHVNKNVKIQGLRPLYERGVILHRMTDREYELELLTFPSGRRDDRIDCMAMALDIVDNTRYTKKGVTKRPHWVGYGRLSSM